MQYSAIGETLPEMLHIVVEVRRFSKTFTCFSLLRAHITSRRLRNAAASAGASSLTAATTTPGSPAATRQCEPKVKGSIGEGPNHSNFSDESSVRILSQNSGMFARKFKKF